MMEDNIVIVLDLGNYRSEFQEKVPFKAKVYEKYDSEVWVRSLKTGREYEIYYNQVLEALEIEEIKMLINLSEYGNYRGDI